MKKIGILLAVLLVIFIMAAFGIAEDKAWFDMGNCDFCKHLAADSLLMENMVWEQYEISNGLLIVTTVKPEFMESYRLATARMKEIGEAMMAGTVADLKTCGHCDYYGMMMQSGAEFEHIETPTGDIDLITSDNEEIIEMIKTYADNNDKAMAAFEEKEAE
ncbi:MAG: hypothetical protein DRP51_06605 [Candidatus Zixiibacteriota bacterium]|nr:MAG: hypothetical protein DRP51_06605 [candidate division Zixibacteria bacterium]